MLSLLGPVVMSFILLYNQQQRLGHSWHDGVNGWCKANCCVLQTVLSMRDIDILFGTVVGSSHMVASSGKDQSILSQSCLLILQ